MGISAGQVLAGRYRVGQQQEPTAHGVVFVGNDETTGDEVVLQVFTSENLPSDQARRDFLSQIRLARGVRHSGVEAVLDVMQVDDVLVVVTERIEGMRLEQNMALLRAAGRGFPEGEVVRIGCELCAALSAIHSVGAHGGVRAENVVLCDDDSVKLTGWVAQVLERGPVAQAPDDQADLARLLCRMLTGAAPPADSSAVAGVSRRLAPVLSRALQPNAAARYA